MKTVVTTFGVLCVCAVVASAQTVRPQGFAPTDPRGCERQMAEAMRNVSMGSFESTFVARTPAPGKTSDAAQASKGPTRQQAMMQFNMCPVESETPEMRGNGTRSVTPIVNVTPTGSK